MTRASCGCLVEDHIILHGYDGPCAEVEPTGDEACAMLGHPPYAADEAGVSHCYCGIPNPEYVEPTTCTDSSRLCVQHYRCGASHPHTRFSCSREEDHSGDHITCGSGDHNIERWNDTR